MLICRFCFLALFVTTLCWAPLVAAQHESPPPSKAATRTSEPNADRPEIEAMKTDLQRMRALLSQMQTNLAFVGNNTSPLNHQFQLEIDMWRVLIDQMERRVLRMEQNQAKSPK